jgi:V-type H+-transporting ATPase subunit a
MHLNDRIQKLCDSFQGKRYQLPSGGHGDRSAFIRKISKIELKLKDMEHMLRLTKEQMH